MLEKPRLLIKGISETIKIIIKEEKGAFFPMLLGALAASISRSALTRRRVIRLGEKF